MWLATDPGTKMGLAWWPEGWNAPKTRLLQLRAAREGHMYSRLRTTYTELLAGWPFTNIALEASILPANVNIQSRQVLLGIRAVIIEVATLAEIPVKEIPSGQWRKHFIGTARSPKGTKNNRAWLKHRAIDECSYRGWDVEGEDTAEAAGILDYVMALNNPAYAVSQSELFRNKEAVCQEIPQPETPDEKPDKNLPGFMI